MQATVKRKVFVGTSQGNRQHWGGGGGGGATLINQGVNLMGYMVWSLILIAHLYIHTYMYTYTLYFFFKPLRE